MNIHEYQAKQVLAEFGAPISKGVPVFEAGDVDKALAELPGPVYVVKSQIHAGGRGKGKFKELADDELRSPLQHAPANRGHFASNVHPVGVTNARSIAFRASWFCPVRVNASAMVAGFSNSKLYISWSFSRQDRSQLHLASKLHGGPGV